MTSLSDRRARFRRLHDGGCFVIPNPWDVGSARYLASLGFPALASTSSGFAWSRGRADNRITLDMAVEHLAALVEATDLPVNADFENGFAHDAAGVGATVSRALETGVAGVSIEDSTGDPAKPLYDLGHGIDRIRAARAAIDKSGADVLLVGRAENFLVGRADLDDTIARLKAYSGAGADVLYAPGLRRPEEVSAAVAAIAPKPFNLLIGWPGGLSVAEAAALGVRRVSVGGALARAAWGGFQRAAQELAEAGRFDALADAAPGTALNALFDGKP